MTNTSGIAEGIAESSPISVGQEVESKSQDSVWDFGTIAVVLIFPLVLAVWYFLDNSWPFWDGANHVLDSMKYRDLLAQPSILKASWWHDFLTVNYCYPPELHLFIGALKLVFTDGLLAEKISQIFFCALMSATIYWLGYQLLGSKRAALSSVLVLNTFPLIIMHSHKSYLDYASLSLFLLAMCSLLFWKRSKTWKAAIAFGIVLGFAVSSKQLASCFLFFPCLAMVLIYAFRKRWKETLQMISAGAVATIFLLVWLVPNIDAIIEFTNRPCSFAENPAFLEVFTANCSGYAAQLPSVISPVLMAVLLVSLFFTPAYVWRKIWLLLASFMGVLFFLGISYNNPEYRYIFPTLALFAILIGSFLNRLLESGSQFLRSVGVLVLLVIAVQYITYCFTPYPISSNTLAWISRVLAAKNSDMYPYSPTMHPTAGGDIWKQEWVVDTVEAYDRQKPVYLFVAPNEPRYNVHTFNVIAKLKGSQMKATTNRLWTLNGDDIKFDPNQLQYYQWFLLKKNSRIESVAGAYRGQESPKDKASEIALTRIENAIQQKCTLVGVEKVADNSTLELYRRN